METNKGNKGYLIGIVLVAVLGGLLFGYDTAVISGAEKGLQAFFIGADDFQYTDAMHGFTCASALIGCIIGSAVSGILASRLGRKRSLVLAGILFFISALGSMAPEFLFFEKGHPTFSLLIAFNRSLNHRCIHLWIGLQGRTLHKTSGNDATYKSTHETDSSSTAKALTNHEGNDHQAHTESCTKVGE